MTNEQDVGADFLVRELARRELVVVRLNTERAPCWRLNLRPTGGWRIRRAERELDSDGCAGVWWRRPEVPVASSAGLAGDAVADQWRAFLVALATVPGPTWVSAPEHIHAAESKALQLRLAGELGMPVPETLWSNDIESARAGLERWGGRAVVKSVASAWWEEADGGRFVFASMVGLDELPSAERLASAPVCFQQPIWPKRDVRVTVAGDRVLAAVREGDGTPDGEPLDWRRGAQRRWTPHDLPSDIAGCCRLLLRQFGLRFGGIDLAIDERGQHWFLELNPNGEWGWLQRAGLPIAEALADVLLSHTG